MHLNSSQKIMAVVRLAFKRLQSAKTVLEVENALAGLGIDASQMDPEKYPKIHFKISKLDIENLKDRGLITKDNLLRSPWDSEPLTNLLYSVLWKNGDLRKIKHIIEGILSNPEDERESGLVFYQFGKYLTKVCPGNQ